MVPEGAVAAGLEEAVGTVIGAVGVEVLIRPNSGDLVPEPAFEGRISGIMVEERRDTGELVTGDMTEGNENQSLKVPGTEKGRRGNETSSNYGP